MAKLALRNRTELIAFALRRGLIPADGSGVLPRLPGDEEG
jgi:hypothetical protein